MKKLLIAAAMAASLYANADTTNVEEVISVDVYDVKLSVNVPTVNSKGYREFKTHKIQGTLEVRWFDVGSEDCEVEFALKDKTYGFDLDIDEGSVDWKSVVIGKKLTDYSVGFTVADENFSLFAAGKGSYTTIKIKSGCSYCCSACGIGLPEKCQKLAKASGYVVGIATCPCGDNSPSYLAATCGASETVSAEAPCYGSWSISYNKKLSYTK